MSDTARASGTRSRLLVLLLAALIMLLPVILLSFTPFSHQASLAFAGVLPAVAAIRFGPRLAVAATFTAAALVALALLAGTHPVFSTVLMALVGLGIGAAAARGWQSIATVIGIQPALLLINTPPQITAFGWDATSPGQILVPVGITILSGLWVVATAGVLLRRAPARQPVPLPARSAWIYGIVMAALLGVTTAVASTWFQGTTAGWMILTILVVTHPDFVETKTLILERSAGTIAGAVVAAMIAVVVPSHTVLVVLALVAALAAIALLLSRAVPVLRDGADRRDRPHDHNYPAGGRSRRRTRPLHPDRRGPRRNGEHCDPTGSASQNQNHEPLSRPTEPVETPRRTGVRFVPLPRTTVYRSRHEGTLDPVTGALIRETSTRTTQGGRRERSDDRRDRDLSHRVCE